MGNERFNSGNQYQEGLSWLNIKWNHFALKILAALMSIAPMANWQQQGALASLGTTKEEDVGKGGWVTTLSSKVNQSVPPVVLSAFHTLQTNTAQRIQEFEEEKRKAILAIANLPKVQFNEVGIRKIIESIEAAPEWQVGIEKADDIRHGVLRETDVARIKGNILWPLWALELKLRMASRAELRILSQTILNNASSSGDKVAFFNLFQHILVLAQQNYGRETVGGNTITNQLVKKWEEDFPMVTLKQLEELKLEDLLSTTVVPRTNSSTQWNGVGNTPPPTLTSQRGKPDRRDLVIAAVNEKLIDAKTWYTAKIGGSGWRIDSEVDIQKIPAKDGGWIKFELKKKSGTFWQAMIRVELPGWKYKFDIAVTGKAWVWWEGWKAIGVNPGANNIIDIPNGTPIDIYVNPDSLNPEVILTQLSITEIK